MGPLTLERLQVLLREQEETEATKAAAGVTKPKRPGISKEAIHKFYRQNGMLAPLEGLWQRPIPPDVYQCPLSAPSTTLVDRNSLPHSVRALYPEEKEAARTTTTIEVDRAHLLSAGLLQAEEAAGAAGASLMGNAGLHRRPLAGNMTSKLTEYTRGVTGRCRPFRPGGMGDEEDHPSANGGEDGKGPDAKNPFLTPQAIEDSMKPLVQGSKASWKDGTLITAPPGVDFQVGLSYQDVYGADDDPRNQTSTDPTPDSQKGSAQVSTSSDGSPDDLDTMALLGMPEDPQQQEHLTPAIRWDQSFLDDDSLFGSSESESDSDDSDDDDDDDSGDDDSEEDGEESAKGDDNDENDDDDDDDKGADAQQGLVVLDLDGVTGSDEDIDKLLKELSRAEAHTKRELVIKKKKNKDDDGGEDSILINPLELAERQARMQNDSTRKTWATTALLPIDDFHSWIPNPAITFPFTLDTFQQQAVARLERNESVFVAAHTSAGKTVVAEYACALAKQRGTRCVYTSPIKALSNQKFRDFSKKFGSENVGLITGDLQLNVDDSTCLIMTTEILRSMLYRGADLIRDIEWVIFDEVHYVNDSERGVVWEEVIIMLPSYVNLIFLSATTPNTLDFSDWIGRTKRKPVHVVKTDYRPVPLSHYLWANLKLHKVMEGKSGFLDKGYQEASNALKPKDADKKGAKGKTAPAPARRGPEHMAWQAQGSKANWMSLIRFLEREELTPTVVFSFSKKKCEEIANMLRSLDLNTAAERSAIQGFTLQTVARLSPNDAILPQVLLVCEMVKRGIGVHHGGLLPILKEMVEILFSRNLIKVLFATETFAMGVNMPARSVVFNSIRKHDGTQFRVLEPGEYTQMAGRAGRRGLDKVGTVIMCCFGESPPPVGILRNMLTGQSTMLRSQFRLTYNMILNLLRVEEMSVEGMIKRSFSEFATQRALTANEYPKLLTRGQKTLAKLEEQFINEASQRVGAEDLEQYFSACARLISTTSQLLQHIVSSAEGQIETVLSTGRIILVSAARKYGVVRTPALVLETKSAKPSSKTTSHNASQSIESLVCMVLLPESYMPESDVTQTSEPKAGGVGSIGFAKHRYYAIYEINLDHILLISAGKKKIDPKLLYKESSDKKASVSTRLSHSSSAFFGAKPMSRGVDDPFAGMIARGKKRNDDDFFGQKKSSISSEAEAIESAVEMMVSAEREELSSGLVALDLRDSVKRGSDAVDFRKRCGYVDVLATQIRQYQSHKHPTLEKYYTIVERKFKLQERVEALSHLLSNESLQLFPDFLQRKAVLQTLGYLDENEAVGVKGRVACEVNSCEELIVTEMVFEGVLNELEPTEIVAALSALLYQQKSDEDFDMEIPDSLLNCCSRMKTIAQNLGQLQKEHGLDLDPLEYADSSLKFGLVHVVYEWALGVPFSNICELTDAQEGSIVRCITRLDELCREVRNCARVVGNPTLYRKMEEASVAIKRDIVFAASLYVS